jgi:hypothetical protein
MSDQEYEDLANKIKIPQTAPNIANDKFRLRNHLIATFF